MVRENFTSGEYYYTYGSNKAHNSALWSDTFTTTQIWSQIANNLRKKCTADNLLTAISGFEASKDSKQLYKDSNKVSFFKNRPVFKVDTLPTTDHNSFQWKI